MFTVFGLEYFVLPIVWSNICRMVITINNILKSRHLTNEQKSINEKIGTIQQQIIKKNITLSFSTRSIKYSVCLENGLGCFRNCMRISSIYRTLSQ